MEDRIHQLTVTPPAEGWLCLELLEIRTPAVTPPATTTAAAATIQGHFFFFFALGSSTGPLYSGIWNTPGDCTGTGAGTGAWGGSAATVGGGSAGAGGGGKVPSMLARNRTVPRRVCAVASHPWCAPDSESASLALVP